MQRAPGKALLSLPPWETRRRRPQRRLGRLVASFALALTLHAGVGAALLYAGAFRTIPHSPLQLVESSTAARSSESDEPLQIDSIVESLEKPPELTEVEKQQKEEQERKDQKGQVVDIAKPAIEMRPDDARFLAEYDSKVNRETKGAVGKGHAGPSAPPVVASPPSPASPPLPPSPPSPPSRSGPPASALSMRGPIGDKVPGPSGESAEVKSLGPDGELPHKMGAGPLLPPDRPGGALPPGNGAGKLPNVVPSLKQLEQAFRLGSSSPDFLEDMEEGDSTSLSAKKWKYAAFFNMVKRAVAEEWHPDEILSKHDPSGNIYGATDRVTIVKVQLNPDGRIADVQVQKTSGVSVLDDEAVAAFRRGQPYKNAPHGLADADGTVRFRFGFIVQMSGRTSYKFYKYRD